MSRKPASLNIKIFKKIILLDPAIKAKIEIASVKKIERTRKTVKATMEADFADPKAIHPIKPIKKTYIMLAISKAERALHEKFLKSGFTNLYCIPAKIMQIIANPYFLDIKLNLLMLIQLVQILPFLLLLVS
jgi:hypothetical protein